VRQTMVNLDPYRNSRGATYNDGRESLGVNAWGNSLPAEELQFGGIRKFGGFQFLLPTWTCEADHLEALGQTIVLPDLSPIHGMALLCFGEMGEQELGISLFGECSTYFEVIAPGWLWERRATLAGEHIALSHLHYPGDYELDLLRPVLWLRSKTWDRALKASELSLSVNPLFHVFSLTLLHPE
jgi:hypothetical protein